jgi:hypothetical protein
MTSFDHFVTCICGLHGDLRLLPEDPASPACFVYVSRGLCTITRGLALFALVPRGLAHFVLVYRGLCTITSGLAHFEPILDPFWNPFLEALLH